MIEHKTIQDILYEALALGGDFAEVFIEDRTNTLYQMVGSTMEKGVRGRDFGIGIRAYLGTKSIYTFSNDTDRDTLIRLLREAFYQVRAGQTAARTMEPLVRFGAADAIAPKEEEKTDLLRRVSQAASAVSDEVKQVLATYLDQAQTVWIANSEGRFVEDHRIRTRLSVSATAEFGGQLQTGSANRGASMAFSFYDGFDVEGLGREAGRIAVTMAHAGYAPAGRMPVVLGNGFGGVLFHEASGHGLEATSVAKGLSVYSGKLGEQVASEHVTAIDDGTVQGAWGSQNLDDEGHETRRNVLIEKGVLKGYLVDRLNGRIMDAAPTGSSRRQSYRYAPTSRMTNTYIAAGPHDPEAIIAATDEGLYARALGGGSVNPATGEFNFAVMEGYLIRGGKIAEPVRGATLLGKGFDFLQSVDMVGNDLQLAQGMCGSVSGSIPVNVGQPTLRVGGMLVGGRQE